MLSQRLREEVFILKCTKLVVTIYKSKEKKMKIISASTEIVEESNDLLAQIEQRGKICYKAEDGIGPGTSIDFGKKIIKNGHNSVLEMATICINKEIREPTPFMKVGNGITSASVRGWREFAVTRPNSGFVPDSFKQHPVLFDDFKDEGCDNKNGTKIIPMPENDLLHTYVCVKVVTNRAVTHEIVRHRPCSFLQESQRYCRYSDDKFDNEVTFIKPMFFKESSREYGLWEYAMLGTETIYLDLLKTSSPQAARTVLPNSCKTEILVYCNLKEWNHIFFQRTSPAAEPSMREVMIPLLEKFRVRFPGHFDTLKPSVG